MVIDGLRASALGCYGNTVSRTPGFDDLASRSAVVDWLWADSPGKEAVYESLWRVAHAARTAKQRERNTPLHALLRQDDVPLRLLTDAPWLASRLPASELENVALWEAESATAAESVGQTAFAQFCSATVEHLDRWLGDGAGSVTWIHTRGLHGVWDAPLEMRAELLDEEDPEPLEFMVPPGAMRVDDPDQLLLHRSAYAAQVSVIDACLAALVEAIEEIMADHETLLMVTSCSGFALGEHGCIGTDCRQLFSERLHLPWLLHICDDQQPRPRIDGLAQPADVPATLLDWLGIEPAEDSDGLSILPHLEDGSNLRREMAYTTGEGGADVIRTPDWLLRREPDDSAQLFAKPDDRWEHNDVAVRCPTEVEQLTELASEVQQFAELGKPLPTSLRERQAD